jgi:hypothetical protein
MPETTSAVALIALNLINVIHHLTHYSNNQAWRIPLRRQSAAGFRHIPYLAERELQCWRLHFPFQNRRENLDLIWMATVKQISGFTAEKIRLATTFVSEPRAAPLQKWQLCSAAADLERITGVIHSERKLVLPNGGMGMWAKSGVGRPSRSTVLES